MQNDNINENPEKDDPDKLISESNTESSETLEADGTAERELSASVEEESSVPPDTQGAKEAPDDPADPGNADPDSELDLEAIMATQSGDFESEEEIEARQLKARAARQAALEEQRIKVAKAKKKIAAVAVPLVLLLVIYLAGLVGFRGRFIPGTRINGIKVGGKTEEEAVAIIKDAVEQYQLKIQFREGVEEILPGSSFGVTYTPSDEIHNYFENRNVAKWLPGLLGLKTDYSVAGAYTYSSEQLKAALLALPEFNAADSRAPVAAVARLGEDNEIYVIPEDEGTLLDPEASFAAVDAAVGGYWLEIDMDQAPGAYVAPAARSTDEAFIAAVNQLNAMLSTVVNYTVRGAYEFTIDRSTIAGWLSQAEDGGCYMDSGALLTHCANYFQALADEYDQINTSLSFQTTNLGTAVLGCNPYGYQIDVIGEAEHLRSDILNAYSEDRTVESMIESAYDANFNGEYIEVDITNQHLYYYKEGELFLDSSLVSGVETNPERMTPSGVFAVYMKQTKRNLTGRVTADGAPEYVTFVNYWMPFYKGYGMHDATWRTEFGGDIYMSQIDDSGATGVYGGSHGCVNLPPDAAQAIYENCVIGTPVIVVRKSDVP